MTTTNANGNGRKDWTRWLNSGLLTILIAMMGWFINDFNTYKSRQNQLYDKINEGCVEAQTVSYSTRMAFDDYRKEQRERWRTWEDRVKTLEEGQKEIFRYLPRGAIKKPTIK